MAPTAKMISPCKLPSAPIPLSKLDSEYMGGGNITTVNVLRGKLDQHRMEAALEAVVNANPILAGRLFIDESSSNGLVVGFPARSSGVEFTAKAMAPEAEAMLASISADEIQKCSSALWETGKSKWDIALRSVSAPVPNIAPVKYDDLTLDATSKPLTTLVIGYGSAHDDLATVSLSISHMLVDSWSYYEVLRLLELEYDEPGSADLALSNDRASVDAAIRLLKATTSTIASFNSEFMFTWHIRSAWRKPATRCCVSMVLSDAQLAKIKSNALRSSPNSEVILSTNDALTAWIGNVLGADIIYTASNLRSKSNELPSNVLANAVVGHLCRTRSKNFHAVDVRESVNMTGAASGPRWYHYLFGKVFIFTNWSKVQHSPSFGLRNQLHASIFGEGVKICDLCYIYKIAPCTTHVHLSLATSDEPKLRAASKALGLDQSMVTMEVIDSAPPAMPSRTMLLYYGAVSFLSLFCSNICSKSTRCTEVTKSPEAPAKISESLMPRLLNAHTDERQPRKVK